MQVPETGQKDLQMTVRLLNHDCDSLTYGGVSYTPDESGAFNVPADVAVVVTNAPGGFYRAPVAPAPAEKPAPRTVDFLAPSPLAVFNVGAVGVPKLRGRGRQDRVRRRARA